MVKIVGIGGSLRPDSHSQVALKAAAQRVEVLGAEVEVFRLADNATTVLQWRR